MKKSAEDYLTSDLRNHVEGLKAAIGEKPTDPSVLKERASLAWEWANALALSGGTIPMEMPFFIEAVFLGDRAGRFSVLKRDPAEASVELDKMIKELKTTHTRERDGRSQDKENEYNMEKLRSLGYM